ncbi:MULTISPECIES: hypothetical protein [Shimia]|uniref:Uncharacterized protein n=1 Tax=Shimia marina TaxID=321267 RepID=A0A0P1F8E9_9RHOB|nr:MULTISPECIES: hypothetical protein [Shimia]CUH51266.1 hypothetical protein SHM7688_00700 [Shimia marina]SFD53578.1 hypothetical protein SAMN04488037_101408 [Shimia marina]
MKTFFMACVAVAVISVVAYYGLHEAGFATSDQASGSSVRLD